MEDVITDTVDPPSPVVLENEDVKNTDSAENFQTFMYDLFEKNGVINDLRAYLRGHIVELLRSSRSGDPPLCQKNFTQRLELPYQALNVLLAEYLLNMEFSYTLSVFISEIPLANMVFAFAKSLMQGSQARGLRFKDDDIWSILNCLGVPCDSERATNIVDMYREEKSPLLLCMLKCTPLYADPFSFNNTTSQDSVSSSLKSSDSHSHAARRCKHVKYCRTCRGNLMRVKEKYRSKKKTLAKNTKDTNIPQNMDSLLKNIEVIERGIIDEMYEELKSVYETEVKLVKTEEEQRVKKSLTSYMIQLEKKKAELEENFRAREVELERNVASKKRFLWGLARLLREQHQNLAEAMRDVQLETTRLAAKEDSLKSQLLDAEQILRQRGEEMRQMISNELLILEQHLDDMKKERDTINKERSELEHLKHLIDSTPKTINLETTKDDLRSHYDLLKNEFNILKSYIKTAKLEPKCVIERSTITDLADGSTGIDAVLNNGQDLDRCRAEDRVKAKRVVNDLKKMKNVNFRQSNLTEIYERSRSSTASGEVGDDTRNMMVRLREENERLRTFARQQREHIDELSSQQARLSAELTAARANRAPVAPTSRPRTAPAVAQNVGGLHGQTTDVSRGYGWQKGAGEEMSFFVNAHPRIIVPGDTLPFIGVVSTRHSDNRRYLINQWRALRRRMSPVGVSRASAAPDVSPTREPHSHKQTHDVAGPSVNTAPEGVNINRDSDVTTDLSLQPTRDCEQTLRTPEKLVKDRDKSAKTVMQEVKERIKSKEYKTRHIDRVDSPNTVLRDAKQRLRKLEIEAEAVERSYLDFRRKREAMRERQKNEDIVTKETDSNRDRSSYEPIIVPMESTSHYVDPTNDEQIIEDIEEYRAKYDISLTHFANKTATPSKLKPIPPEFAYETLPKTKKNYVDTPLQEFRKYYQSESTYKEKEFFEQPGTSVAKTVEHEIIAKTPIVPRLTNETRIPSPMIKNRKSSPERRDSRSVSPANKNEPKSSKNRDNSQRNTEVQSRNRSPKNSPRSPKIEASKEMNPTKALELEILKENISKIYNIPQNTIANNVNGFDEDINNTRRNMGTDIEKGIINDTITEVSPNETRTDIEKLITNETVTEISPNKTSSDISKENKNLLRVDVETFNNEIKLSDSKLQDLVIESSIKAGDSDSEVDQAMPTQMSIIVSPKSKIGDGDEEIIKPADINSKPTSPKLQELKTLNQEQLNQSIEIPDKNSNDVLVTFLSDDNEDPEYPDDFSPEVENLENSSSRKDNTGDQSSISMAKISEDDNFWDS